MSQDPIWRNSVVVQCESLDMDKDLYRDGLVEAARNEDGRVCLLLKGDRGNVTVQTNPPRELKLMNLEQIRLTPAQAKQLAETLLSLSGLH